MKKYLSAWLLLFSGVTIFAAEPEIKNNYWAKEKNGTYVLSTGVGKTGILSSVLPMKKGEYLRISYQVRGDGKSGLLCCTSGFSDKNSNLYSYEKAAASGKRIHYCYALEDAEIKLQIFGKSEKKTGSLNISDLKLEKSADFKKLNCSPYENQSWKSCFQAEVSTVSAEDHLEGGTAVQIRNGSIRNGGAQTFSFPFLPDSQYRITFWAKSPEGCRYTLWVDGWTPNRPHWYSVFKFSADKEYQLKTLELKTPADAAERCRGLARLRFQLPPDQTLLIKDIVIERLEK